MTADENDAIRTALIASGLECSCTDDLAETWHVCQQNLSSSVCSFWRSILGIVPAVFSAVCHGCSLAVALSCAMSVGLNLSWFFFDEGWKVDRCETNDGRVITSPSELRWDQAESNNERGVLWTQLWPSHQELSCVAFNDARKFVSLLISLPVLHGITATMRKTSVMQDPGQKPSARLFLIFPVGLVLIFLCASSACFLQPGCQNLSVRFVSSRPFFLVSCPDCGVAALQSIMHRSLEIMNLACMRSAEEDSRRRRRLNDLCALHAYCGGTDASIIGHLCHVWVCQRSQSLKRLPHGTETHGDWQTGSTRQDLKHQSFLATKPWPEIRRRKAYR